jgi:hypothetical protein
MKTINLDWEKGSNFHVLTADFIRKNWSKVLEEIKVKVLSEEIINKFSEQLNSLNVHSLYYKEFWFNVNLDENYIRKHKDLLNWIAISKKQILSEKFIEEMRLKVNWLFIFNFQYISYEFLKKHITKLSLEEIGSVDFGRHKLTQYQYDELRKKIKLKYMFQK